MARPALPYDLLGTEGRINSTGARASAALPEGYDEERQ